MGRRQRQRGRGHACRVRCCCGSRCCRGASECRDHVALPSSRAPAAAAAAAAGRRRGGQPFEVPRGGRLLRAVSAVEAVAVAAAGEGHAECREGGVRVLRREKERERERERDFFFEVEVSKSGIQKKR